MNIRTNSLVIGPSGSGKSFLARSVAGYLGLPFLPLSSADWVLVGCNERGAVNTWPSIVQFLQENRRKEGVVIFVDEVQHACGDSTWERFLRVELFALLDLRIPRGIKIKSSDDDEDFVLSGETLTVIEEVLANRTLIIAAGAFQAIWEKSEAPSIGFHDHQSGSEMPTLKTLTETLPTELINRFRSELLILRPLKFADYQTMLETTAKSVPSYLRETFLRLGRGRLPEVVRLRQGTRFLEELMLDTILAERAAIRNFKPPSAQLEFPLGSDSLSIDPML